MMDGMMSGSMGMMLFMGGGSFLVLILLVLAAAALVKYLFSNKQSVKHEETSDDKHGF